MANYEANIINCNRQWYYSSDYKNSVDMVLVVNGIPVFAFELKNQYTGQTVDNAKRQWMYDRDPREICFQFNKRILTYFCIDHTEVWMATKLAGKVHSFYHLIKAPMALAMMAAFYKELHQEFIFCSYLIKLLPAEKVEMIDIESKLKLEYYKLQKTFEGAITLEEKKGSYTGGDTVGGKDENKKTPLDEIIEKINEKYKGLFSDVDRVLIISLQDKLMKNDKLKKIVKTTEPKIFNDIFPKIFGNVAEESYTQSQEAYISLFQDTTKYNTIMQVLADYVYTQMRK